MRWLLQFIALRRLHEGRLRSALTLLGIAAGVASLVATGAANEAILKGFRDTLSAVGGEADVSITGAVPGQVAEEAIEATLAIAGVKSVSPAITEVAKLADNRRIYVFGLDLAAGDDARGLDAFGGGGELPDAMTFLNDPDGVLLSKGLAASLAVRVGGTFEIVTSKGLRTMKVHGLVGDEGPARAFGGQVAIMDLFNAQAAFGRGRRIDRIDVTLEQGSDLDRTISLITAAVGPGPRVGRPERRDKSSELMLRSFQVGLFMGSAVSLLVGLFLVFNTVSFAVAQRRREIGTLRALGVTRGQIAGLFAIEAAFYGLVGAVLGLLGGLALARVTVARSLSAVNNAYMSVNVSDAGVSTQMLGVGLVMGVLGAVLAALIPALEAAGVSPVEALRRDRQTKEGRAPTLLGRLLPLLVAAPALVLIRLPLVDGAPIFGNLALALIALAAALGAVSAVDLVHFLFRKPVGALFGAPGRIALAGLVRARRRSGVAAGAVLIGLALVLCLATFVGSFRGALERWLGSALPADLFVASGSSTIGFANTPLDPSIGEELRSLPGLAELQPTRLVWTEARGLRIGLFAFDWAAYMRYAQPLFTDGDGEASLRGMAAGGVLVSDNFARKSGTRVGDEVTLATPSGPKSYRVAAALIDYSSDQGAIVMDRATYLRDFGDPLVDSFDLYAVKGADLQAMRTEIERRLGDRLDLRVVTNAELRGVVFALVDDFFSLVYALLFIASAIGVAGIAGTLLAQVLDRTREIGILRATGASRGQIVGSVAIEAALLGIAGALLGVPTGLLMGKFFVDVVGVQATGWVFPTVVPVAFALTAAGVSILFSAAGGLLPARRAARLDVIEAIGYE